MSKIHLHDYKNDCRVLGQTEHEYKYQTMCGFVRKEVTNHIVIVDCKLCLRATKK